MTIEDDIVRLHNDPSYPKSEAVQGFVVAREQEGERFMNVSRYRGE
jgi:hypothetical protein